jgi:hypothetical protein
VSPILRPYRRRRATEGPSPGHVRAGWRTGEFDHRPNWLRIDNTDLPPDEVAERIIRHFSLPRAAGG